MSAANHAPDARLDPFALDVELSLLLSSTAPPGWRSAVEEAAHLLSDRYSDDWAELHTLALLLFARTFSGARTPRDVPVEELVQALDDPSTGENRVTEEIRQALKATGQEYDTGLPDEEPPLRLIFGPVSDRYGGPAHWSDEWDPVPPGPSPLDRAAKRLVGYLSTYEASHRDRPTSVPDVGEGPLHVESDGIVMASRNSLVPPSCSGGCAASRPRRLTVDGPVATLNCEGCDTRRRWKQLDPTQVRLALARTLGVAPSVQGSYSVPGELYVPLADMSRGADPYQYNWFLSDRGKEKLGPTGRKKS
ncbi:hypothetical protein [Streptomyces sp. NBC_01358]|uniref:hypothetical protein n=1 Tax=Streptomyces sp. NBC_01358 TaxID=2903837 RepID=UPI002E358621|nr:hypothetical protein [Streptomyces sp. NBC_01358]WSW65621.1 hypothetical protein OG461_05135 [Streptomyces sp. NBC_00995]